MKHLGTLTKKNLLKLEFPEILFAATKISLALIDENARGNVNIQTPEVWMPLKKGDRKYSFDLLGTDVWEDDRRGVIHFSLGGALMLYLDPKMKRSGGKDDPNGLLHSCCFPERFWETFDMMDSFEDRLRETEAGRAVSNNGWRTGYTYKFLDTVQDLILTLWYDDNPDFRDAYFNFRSFWNSITKYEEMKG